MKYNETVYVTSTVKTSASNTIIEFPNDFVIPELDPGFKIQVEVYALRTFKQTDVIPHNMKYHIKVLYKKLKLNGFNIYLIDIYIWFIFFSLFSTESKYAIKGFLHLK